MELKNLVQSLNSVEFDSYRQGIFYYNLNVCAEQEKPKEIYQFTVPADDIGNATLLKKDKAITFMRWIRKAKQENTLIKIQ